MRHFQSGCGLLAAAAWAVLGILGVPGDAGEYRVPGASIDVAAWFPDPPHGPRYDWTPYACPHCRATAVPAEWRAMAQRAGVPDTRFLVDPHASGDAYAAASDAVVFSPALRTRPRCEQAFVIGHELAHLARRHHDEDAAAALVHNGRPTDWTRDGARAVGQLDGNFGLALRLAPLWQSQEHEADWLGSLLAAEVAGCRMKTAAAAYLADATPAGGFALTHPDDARRLADLEPFRGTADQLAGRLRTVVR